MIREVKQTAQDTQLSTGGDWFRPGSPCPELPRVTLYSGLLDFTESRANIGACLEAFTTFAGPLGEVQ